MPEFVVSITRITKDNKLSVPEKFVSYLVRMKKLAGVFLIIAGVILILFSIIILVKAFDTFSAMGSSAESIGYTIGNILFPLLLTVIGRWIYRKGLKFWREK